MRISKALEKFNKMSTVWLSDLESLSEEELSINPSEGSWSLAELYDHIMRVARTYQIPNLQKSITTSAVRKKRKKVVGFAVFNLGVRRQVKIQMENFPAPLVEKFTPEKRSKAELIEDFQSFIEEVNKLESVLMKSTKYHKQYHPMFGDITTVEWFSLIGIHMVHHDVQRARIKRFAADIRS